jgi:polyhydroxyalkanoate synthesis regulator phasin
MITYSDEDKIEYFQACYNVRLLKSKFNNAKKKLDELHQKRLVCAGKMTKEECLKMMDRIIEQEQKTNHLEIQLQNAQDRKMLLKARNHPNMRSRELRQEA